VSDSVSEGATISVQWVDRNRDVISIDSNRLLRLLGKLMASPVSVPVRNPGAGDRPAHRAEVTLYISLFLKAT